MRGFKGRIAKGFVALASKLSFLPRSACSILSVVVSRGRKYRSTSCGGIAALLFNVVAACEVGETAVRREIAILDEHDVACLRKRVEQT